MRTSLPLLAVLAAMLACAESEPPAPAEAAPVETASPLTASTERAEVEDLGGGFESWVFDIDVTNNGDAPFAGRLFVHGETPTGDVAHRGVFPGRTRTALTERVKRMDFGPSIGPRLLDTGHEVALDPGETYRVEGGIPLPNGLRAGYRDAVLLVYDLDGRKVFDQQVATP